MKRLLSGIYRYGCCRRLSGSNAGSGPAPDASARQVETYESAVIDRNGHLRITTSDRRTIVVPKN